MCFSIGTSNTKRPTSNIELEAGGRKFRCWAFNVGCSMFSNFSPARNPGFRHGWEFTFSLGGANGYDARMALMRILVDGYSLLHNWPELAPGQPRHSERARNELVHLLTRYHDTTGTP